MTYNLYFKNKHKESSVKIILNANVDLLVLQEITLSWNAELSRSIGHIYPYSKVIALNGTHGTGIILGQIIAAVSGLSFDEFMETRIFQPLQLTRTSYLLSNFQAQEIAQPHNAHPNRVTERFPYNRAFSPSGNLFTSIEDINRWMLFNLNKGRLGNFEPLPPEKFALLTTPRVPTEEDGSVGLSWFVDKNLIFHDGLDLGYTALMVFFEKQRIGITVLINHQEGNCNELLNLIVKSIKY